MTALLKELARAPARTQGGDAPHYHAGQVVGRFELVREIGRGGFGVVFEALDRELGRPVAFKAIRTGGCLDIEQERLLREAEAAARLAHPNIVTLTRSTSRTASRRRSWTPSRRWRGCAWRGGRRRFPSRERATDVRTIGQKLGVRALLEGSVRKAGDRVRITAKLVSAGDGYHLWSQSYDRELTDVFAVQDGSCNGRSRRCA